MSVLCLILGGEYRVRPLSIYLCVCVAGGGVNRPLQVSRYLIAGVLT